MAGTDLLVEAHWRLMWAKMGEENTEAVFHSCCHINLTSSSENVVQVSTRNEAWIEATILVHSQVKTDPSGTKLTGAPGPHTTLTQSHDDDGKLTNEGRGSCAVGSPTKLDMWRCGSGGGVCAVGGMVKMWKLCRFLTLLALHFPFLLATSTEY